MRELGAEIDYCTERRSYYYETPLPVDLGQFLNPDPDTTGGDET